MSGRHWRFEKLRNAAECLNMTRILYWYQTTAVKSGNEYLNWFKLYRFILLHLSLSMSLERLFRERKLYQPAQSSNYVYERLSDRLVLHYNSADEGSADAVILCMKLKRSDLI